MSITSDNYSLITQSEDELGIYIDGDWRDMTHRQIQAACLDGLIKYLEIRRGEFPS